MSIDSRQLRSALGAFATGVTIVTARNHESGEDAGLTVNSFSSVSLDPPMVLWSLAKNAYSCATFLNAEYFGVHILAADQSDLSARFATRGADKFSGLELQRGHGNIPLIDGCAARFECKTVFRYEGGDHDILVGEVVSFENFDRQPLVFVAGRYAIALDKPEQTKEPEAIDLQEQGMVTSLQYLLGSAHYQCQMGIRPELARCSLTEQQLFILGAVAFNAQCTVDDVIRLVWISGYKITGADIDKLAQRKLLEVEPGPTSDAHVRVTEAGQTILVRIAAVNKSIEAEAMKDLGYMEIQVFKQMLRKIVERTRPSWRKPL